MAQKIPQCTQLGMSLIPPKVKIQFSLEDIQFYGVVPIKNFPANIVR